MRDNSNWRYPVPVDANPGPGERDDPAEPEQLSTAFWTVARRLRHGSQRTLAPFDLSPAQSRALGMLLRHGAMRLGGLAEHLGIAARSATEVVDALEQRDLVARAPDPSDRRATLVEATPAGRSLMTRVRESRLREADELFARLDPADRAELARLLRALSDDDG